MGNTDVTEGSILGPPGLITDSILNHNCHALDCRHIESDSFDPR